MEVHDRLDIRQSSIQFADSFLKERAQLGFLNQFLGFLPSKLQIFERFREHFKIRYEDRCEMLASIADDTRLRVLKLIAERPRTTQELAPLVGLSNAGLSKSLRRLAEAGLISSRRQGYYVVYSLDEACVRAASAELGSYLGVESEQTFPSDPPQ